MKSRLSNVIVFILMMFFFAQACDSGNDAPVSGGDVDGDADNALTVPNEPAAPDASVVVSDEPFLQEFNHTIAEQPPEIGALAALVMPPASFTDFDRPTLVAPRGLWLPADGGGLELLELPETATDIIDAEATGDAVYLLTADSVYPVSADGVIGTAMALPDGATGIRLVVSGNTLYILTSAGPGSYSGSGDITWYTMNPAPTAACATDDTLYLAYEGSLAAYPLDQAPDSANQLWEATIDVGVPVALIPDRSKPVSMDMLVVGTAGLAGLTLSTTGAAALDVALFAADRIPLAGAVTAIPDSNGGLVVAATGGAYRIVEQEFGMEYRVYVPERWMPGADIRDVLEDTSEANGPMYFATTEGLGSMTRSMWTIKDKTDAMIERIALRHNREGALADSHLTSPGDLSTNIMYDSDNDGGWTCYWVLSECFRWKLTGDAEAKAHFDESLARMLSFRTLTGTDYFLARSVIRIDGCQLDDCDNPDDGEWFKSPDGEWWVKADTSNDEVTSHMFMMGQAYDYCADDDQKAAIIAHVDGIIGGIVDHGYQLIDPQDEKCTSYGQFDPEYVNIGISGSNADGGRRSAQMLGALNLAYYLTVKQKYLDAKAELIEDYHYDENVSNIGDKLIYPFCAGSGDCDELAFQAFVPLLRYEWDPALRQKWMTGWNRLYTHLQTQEDMFWDVANASFGGENIDLAMGKRWYRRYPTDLVRWKIFNDGVRLDATKPPSYYNVKDRADNYRLRSDGHIIPADERPNIRHNTPQFQFSGGWGSLRELDGGDALYPYWLGRYYGFIAAP